MGRETENCLVTVIVTTRNNEATIANCLNSVRQQRYRDVEVIVVDNSSSDRTREIAERLADIVLERGPERSAQRNCGVDASRGSCILILDSDMEISPGVVSSCVQALLTDDQVRAVVVPEESFGKGFWARCKALERSYYLGLDWMEAARFFDKETLLEVGGYDEENTGTEDYDLPARIGARYGQPSIARIEDLIYHNEGYLRFFDLLRKKYYYGKGLEIYRSREDNDSNFMAQVNLVKRFAIFFRSPRKLLDHPLVGTGMLFMKPCEFGALSLGYLCSRINRTTR